MSMIAFVVLEAFHESSARAIQVGKWCLPMAEFASHELYRARDFGWMCCPTSSAIPAVPAAASLRL